MVSSQYLAAYHDKHASWFAMDDGILKKTRRKEQDHTSILPYTHISSITAEYRSYHKLIYLGVLGIIFALVALLIYLIKDSIPDMLNGIDLPWLIALADYGPMLFLILLGLGFFLVIAGMIYKEIYYKFTGAGIDKHEWSMYSHRSRSKEELIQFLNIVRDKMKESHSVRTIKL